MYVFDRVLKPNVTQEQVYHAAAKSIVKGENGQRIKEKLYTKMDARKEYFRAFFGTKDVRIFC